MIMGFLFYLVILIGLASLMLYLATRGLEIQTNEGQAVNLKKDSRHKRTDHDKS